MKKVFSLLQRRRVMAANELAHDAYYLDGDLRELLLKLADEMVKNNEAIELCIKQNQQAAKARLI